MSHTLHHETLERGLGGFKIEQRYAVVLVDFWTEGKEKTMVYTTWPDYLDSGPFEITCHRGFENLVTDEEWKHNYKIMLAVKKL